MENQILHRHVITLPAFSDLPEDLRVLLAAASGRLGEFLPVASGSVIEAPRNLMAPLRHERLSDPFLERNGAARTPPRASGECAVLERFGESLKLADRASFPRVLLSINQAVVGPSGDWRCSSIGTEPDRCGNRVAFPSQRHVVKQLDRLHGLLHNADLPAVFIAAMSLALLTNSHGFNDGNGRVARILFNHALRQGGLPGGVYIPFSELAGRSDGGYLIALRQGELRNEWEPFLKFILTMLSVHETLSKSCKDAAG